MKQMMTRIARMLAAEDGATAVEYVVIASTIGLALIPVLATTTTSLQDLFNRVNAYFSGF